MPRLLLARKEGQRIVIQVPGHGLVWINVEEINRSSVRLSFDAGPSVKVDREEIYLARVCQDD